MAKQTALEITKGRIQDLQKQKADDLATVYQKQVEAQTQKEAAELAIKESAGSMNLEAYEAAVKAKDKAQVAIDMYRDKYDQINKQEYISEADSDKVIDSLLAYEDELAADFKAAIAEPLRILDNLQRTYLDAIADTEQTIKAWTDSIHANYRSETTTYNGTGSNRSLYPIPVHRMPFYGCGEATRLAEYLRKESGIHTE